MRFAALLTTLVLVATTAAPAAACIVPPNPRHMYWPSAPKAINPGEVALEVVLVRHLTLEEFQARHPTADRVVITDCGAYSRSTYRVARVLSGDYKGPTEIDAEVYGGIVDESNTGQSRIVVGTLHPSYGGSGFFEMRSWVGRAG